MKSRTDVMLDIDDDVIRRAAQGDAGAFEAILKSYGDLVFNVSLRVVRHREDAEEVAQEVFLTIYRKLKDFQWRSSFKTWVYRVTINTAINYAKRVAGMKNRSVEYNEAVHAGESSPSDVQQSAEKEYAQGVVDRLLGELSEEQRACIVLRNMEGLKYEEIAGVLGIDINAVRSRLKRARVKLLSVRDEVMANEM
ncbi:MAG: sigma-70 family RNA polymerase sigma factor [Candidatus Omnitrophica bacterium]|nr:sigma-70 family RNA polymerase sigma factor [Candidatus Omnitrophota bacterium]